MDIKIKLRDYQETIAEKIDFLYESGKNFAGIILATGGGKSFLGMDQIIKFANKYNDKNPITKEQMEKYPGALSLVTGYYVCPQNPISLQFRIHMLQNVIAPEHIIKYENENGEIRKGKEIETVKELLQKMAPKLNLSEIKFETFLEDAKKVVSDVDENTGKSVVDKMLKDILVEVSDNNKERIVNDAFPNVNFITYKSLESKSDAEMKKMKADFIILDEAHRSGAEKWWPKVKKLIKYSGAKVLSITATPERDLDEKDMMRDLALLDSSGYTVREVRNKEYLAGNIPLLNAIENGYINPPDVVHFNCKLDETPEFENAVRAFVKSSIKMISLKKDSPTYNNAMTSKISIEDSLAEMLILIRKDPLIDYDESLSLAEKEIRKKEDEENVRKQINGDDGSVTLMRKLSAIIKDGNQMKLSEDEIYASCMKEINSSEWQELKKTRVSTIISKELKSRDLETTKAINFMEPMENANGTETADEKKARAKKHVETEIQKLKELFDEKIIKMPIITAMHSTAFSDSENDEILNQFLKKNTSGVMKIISAVSKFNEGFHADGVRALFMTSPIKPNNNKKNEPRIKLLQQIGRCLSAGQKEKSVIFDITCNFMRNHEKFNAECKKDCFAFLRLSKEEEKFMQLSRKIQKDTRKKSEEKIDTEKLITILSVLNKKGIKVNSDKIPNNINLQEFINKIEDKELREEILDDLFLEDILLERDFNFELGLTYRFARDVYIGKVTDISALKNLSQYELSEMLKLGIIETETKEGNESLVGRINKTGFIVKGIVESTFGYNVYTGTKFDGPDNDLYRKDYYGCGPDGRDPAGYDKYGFDAQGIHRITGKNYDERHFVPVKEIDKSGKEIITWYYENPETGERVSTDPLGYNHDGINPETGFDRNGYWHRKENDGSFSIVKSLLNDKRFDVHNFFFRNIKEKLGLYMGIKMKFKNDKGLHSNGSILQSGITKESDKYDSSGYDIDGFDPKGFNENGIHRNTSVKYGLDGKDKEGKMQPDLFIAQSLLDLLKKGKIEPQDIIKKLRKSPEEIDKVLDNAYTISRTLKGIDQMKNPESNLDVIGLIQATRENPKAVDVLFKLSSSMKRQVEKSIDANRAMNEYYIERTDKIIAEVQKGNSKIVKVGEIDELKNVNKRLENNVGSVKYREQNDDDFVL